MSEACQLNLSSGNGSAVFSVIINNELTLQVDKLKLLTLKASLYFVLTLHLLLS